MPLIFQMQQDRLLMEASLCEDSANTTPIELRSYFPTMGRTHSTNIHSSAPIYIPPYISLPPTEYSPTQPPPNYTTPPSHPHKNSPLACQHPSPPSTPCLKRTLHSTPAPHLSPPPPRPHIPSSTPWQHPSPVPT